MIVELPGTGCRATGCSASTSAPRLGAELQAGFDARLAELELVNERSDLASVMRLPGTFNVKAEWVLV